jgi:diamine N-acetyltransferase
VTPPAFGAASYAPASHITLRAPGLDDATALGSMLAAIDPWRRYPVTAATLAGFFAEVETGAPRFAIHVDGALAGGVAIRTTWFAGPYIQTFGLAPSAQGHGIGATVMTFIEAEARRINARNLWVAASDFNIGAHRFYERFGFAPVARIPGLLQNDRDEILLRKRLVT